MQCSGFESTVVSHCRRMQASTCAATSKAMKVDSVSSTRAWAELPTGGVLVEEKSAAVLDGAVGGGNEVARGDVAGAEVTGVVDGGDVTEDEWSTADVADEDTTAADEDTAKADVAAEDDTEEEDTCKADVAADDDTAADDSTGAEVADDTTGAEVADDDDTAAAEVGEETEEGNEGADVEEECALSVVDDAAVAAPAEDDDCGAGWRTVPELLRRVTPSVVGTWKVLSPCTVVIHRLMLLKLCDDTYESAGQAVAVSSPSATFPPMMWR
jgi:hypothetical protein